MRGDARLGTIRLLLVLTLAIFTQAGPVNRASYTPGDEDLESRQQFNDDNGDRSQLVGLKNTSYISEGCIFGAKKFILGESVPSIKPCEVCLCTEKGIQCLPVACEVKPGCKALHRADHCCPLYQCECERNGITYSNGEKLIDPENPCQNCYCQGGEIVCNKIACFIKNDCEPRYVVGRCCPEYDNCPPRDKITSNTTQQNDFSQKLEPQKAVDKTFDFRNEYDSSNEDVKSQVFDDGNVNSQEISFAEDTTDDRELNLDDLSYSTSSSAEVTTSKTLIVNLSYSNLLNDNVPGINIKEVTYDKPINNEIRIKEILPTSNVDLSSISTKSPTYPREATYTNDNKKKGLESDVKNDTESENVAIYQTPPILRIGDQLVYLNHGDLVTDNNSSMNTPAPVFTVIGAEGLQRVIEDPEETFESKYVSEENQDETQYEIERNNIYKKSPSVNTSEENVSTSSIDEGTNETSVITSSEDPEKILQEVISELYETTTVENDSSEENNDIERNFIKTGTKVDSNSESDSSHETVGSGDSSTEDPQLDTDKSSVLEESQQAIPIEHLPEHNPEYPPIPEDIMILSMTEDSLESSEIEFSGASPSNQEIKDDDKIIIVKRPVIPNPSFSNSAREKTQKDVKKILPDIIVSNNNSTENLTHLVPEEWLKVEETGQLTNTELSENISLSPVFKDSNEEDDSKDYIFISSNSKKVIKSETTTEEPIEIKHNYSSIRSPGEPLLIPEWERNRTTEVPEGDLNTGPDLIIELNGNQTEILSNDTILINVSFDEKDDKNIVEKSYQNTNFSDSLDIILTDVSNIENLITKGPEINISTEQTLNNEVKAPENVEVDADPINVFTEDTLTNLIISTEDSLAHVSTKGTSDIIVQSTKPDNLEQEKVVLIEESSLHDASQHTMKQKKTPTLIADVKNDNSHTAEKKGNILADLISLVGDVANIGNHEVELSTVHNSIDNEKYTHAFERSTEKPRLTTEDNSMVTEGVEITEYSLNEKSDVPLENDKVEFTTKKIYIDSDSDERSTWKSIDHIVKDIEIVPKVGNKNKKQVPEKIVEKHSEDGNKVDSESVNKIQSQIQNIVDKKDVALSTTTTTTTTTSVPITVISSTTTATPVPTTVVASTSIKDTERTTVKPLINKTRSELTTSQTISKISQSNPTQSSEIVEDVNPTVMKLSIKNDANKDDDKNGEKLTKRETNSQVAESSGQIDESLISILREFFEKQYRH